MQPTGTTHTQIVRRFITALEQCDYQQAASYLADTFLFNGWTPKPLPKETFLNVIKGLKTGLPDLSFQLHNEQEWGDQIVSASIQATGTQTSEFVIPELSLPPIPEAAAHVSLPREKVTFQLGNEKIEQMLITPVQDGDLHGLLRQLGVEVPIIQ